jgi:DHA2 family methylenomycin A resistance protein-like MFS transporter
MALIAALLAFFMTILDASAVNVGLSAIAHDLRGGMSGLQWVVDAYTLMFAALMLSAGALSDRVGARRAFGIGLAVFTAASVACGLAPSLGVLVGARVVQGASAALMMPASLALVRQVFAKPAERAKAISIVTAGASVAIAAGPVAGGLLTSAWSWRGIFFINVPVGVLALLLVGRTPASARRPAGLDMIGQVSAVAALAGVTFTVIQGGHAGYASPQVVAAMILALAGAVVFLVAESRQAEPMVPLGIFRSRAVTASVLCGFAINVGYYGIVFVLSIYFQQIRGYSPLEAGLMFVPMTVLIMLMNLAGPAMAARFGVRAPIATGLGVMTLGLLGLLAVGSTTPVALLTVLVIPVGLGGSMAVPTLTAVLLEAVPSERAGLAAGVLNAARQVGGGLAVALFGSLVAGRTDFHHGMVICLLAVAALLLSTAATAMALLPRGDGR